MDEACRHGPSAGVARAERTEEREKGLADGPRGVARVGIPSDPQDTTK
jgi:hypothetical protein